MPPIGLTNGNLDGTLATKGRGPRSSLKMEEQQMNSFIASRKKQLTEQDYELRANGLEQNNNNNNNKFPVEGEVFHDTQTLRAHATDKSLQDDEPIVIFDTQSNTSIAQTAKDQFAAALLRLQSGLGASSQRLNLIESKVDDLARQQQQAKQQQNRAKSQKAEAYWAAALLGNGRLGTLLYLGWPVLVFVAMRALERRAMLKKLS